LRDPQHAIHGRRNIIRKVSIAHLVEANRTNGMIYNMQWIHEVVVQAGYHSCLIKPGNHSDVITMIPCPSSKTTQ